MVGGLSVCAGLPGLGVCGHTTHVLRMSCGAGGGVVGGLAGCCSWPPAPVPVPVPGHHASLYSMCGCSKLSQRVPCASWPWGWALIEQHAQVL